MTTLEIRASEDCLVDCLALGEVMLRLDPGVGRIRTARTFDVWEGGGEYNVARGLRRCFGLRTAIATALVDNEVGRLIEGMMLSSGIDTSHVVWRQFDGIGRSVRNGLNFTERGFGVRGALGVSDRGNSAASGLKPGDIDWDYLFGEVGVRWFHTGGIFAGLSSSTPEVLAEAMESARRFGTVVSYDLNYRPSLWKSLGGQEAAQKVNKSLAPLVDVMIGNEEDFTASLGLEAPSADENLLDLDPSGFRDMIVEVGRRLPTVKAVATTLRGVQSANKNDWSAIAWSVDEGFAEATPRKDLEIFDRVGGGDSFASGLIFGLMMGESLAMAVELGAAHGALAMTTPGDTSMATKAEVFALARGGNARVVR